MNVDKETQDAMVRQNIGLIVMVAKELDVYHDFEHDDLIQEGSYAIWQAIPHFEEERGLRFSTLARTFIRNHLLNIIAAKNRQKRRPKDGYFICSIDNLRENHQPCRRDPSFNESDDAPRIKKYLGTLDARSREIIAERFGFHGDDPKTLKQVGNRLGITRERVRQIESNALSWIRRLYLSSL